MTIRGLFREFAIAKTRNEDAYDLMASGAWLTAALSRQNKLPELDKVLIHKRQRPIETEAQARAEFAALVAAYGGTTRKTRLRRVKLPEKQTQAQE